jgi:hypothetical protein
MDFFQGKSNRVYTSILLSMEILVCFVVWNVSKLQKKWDLAVYFFSYHKTVSFCLSVDESTTADIYILTCWNILEMVAPVLLLKHGYK